jgi:hypothetical protein
MCEIRVGGGPRTQFEVYPLKQGDILTIVAAHGGPRFWVTAHATEPEMLSGMRELAADPEVFAKVIQFIAIELEVPPGNLEGVHRLVWARRLHPLSDEAGVGLPQVEAIPIVRYDDIGIVDDRPQVLN